MYKNLRCLLDKVKGGLSMAKTTAWLATLIGLLLVPPIKEWVAGLATFDLWGWLIALFVLIIGVTKLMRNYKQ